ncbi:MAG: septum site-determining protein MinC [Anaerolineae bacterium]|nr:septum site-determining protein MinC [Anaerolineae bacterium]
MTESITIKGTSEGLIITLGPGPFEAVVGEMEERLASRASFFRGGRVALRVGDRSMSAEQLQAIGAILERMGMTLWAVDGDHPATYVAARELELEVDLRPSAPPAAAASEPISLEEMAGIVVHRTLRSGQAVHYPGHVTLIGDVNPGAEIVAGGDIVVWGRLRGNAHAGAMGDEQAVICALQMQPNQIRIGAHIARPPDRSWRPKAPEKASVQDGGIVVERWKKSE